MGHVWIRGALAALMLAPGAAWAEGKAALIIGNAAYEIGPKALSAERDTEAVAGALEEAGYEVTYGLNLDRLGMRDLMAGFFDLADTADQIVIYYSGHAMRLDGRTYLAPIEYAPDDPVAIMMDGVPLETLMKVAARKAGAAVLFLDGAQRTGFAPHDGAEPGLASIEPPEGVLVVSAAAPGEAVARSRWRGSTFAATILDDFLAEGAEAMDVVAALDAPAWSVGWVDADLALVPRPEPEPVVATTSSDIAQQIELAFWQSTEAAGTRADYEAYLRRYPNGLFADIARNRVGAPKPAAPAPETQVTETPAPETPVAETPVVRKPAAPTPPRAPTVAELAAAAEAALGLSRDQRRRVQSDLTALGYDTRGIDGLFGRATRGAIRGWQSAEDYRSTGYLTAKQVAALRQTAGEVIAAREQEKAERARLSAEEAARRDEGDWQRTRAVGTTSAYQRYLDANPDGKYAPDARRILADARADEDERTWKEALRLDNEEAYAVYLDRFPDGRHAVEAQRRYDLLGDAKTVEDPVEAAAEQAKEDAAFLQAELANTAAGYLAFLQKYPNSDRAELAKERRTALVQERRVRREEGLRLGAGDWAAIQKLLARSGFRPGNQKGRVTKKTRQAVRDYRRSRGLPVHGFVDRKLLEVLRSEG